MALISQRLRLMPCTTLLFLIAAGCSLMNSLETTNKPERAGQLAKANQHVEAAELYAALAAEPSPERDDYLLQSARQWLAANKLGEAKQSYLQVSSDARARLPGLRAIVAARIALMEQDGARAIHELDQTMIPTKQEEAAEYWAIRSESAFLSGHPAEGVRASVERDRWLDAKAVQSNHTQLYEQIRAAAMRGSLLKPSKADPVVAGWLDLGPIAVELARDPMRAGSALATWRRNYPNHPANDGAIPVAQSELVAETQFPAQIALLLPLSGRAETIGVAVRDGFIAAYLEQDVTSRPRLKIYDVAEEPASTLYNRAIAEGAGFVVGPLTKEDVAAVAPLCNDHAPTLALNFLSDGITSSNCVYQFALLPEDEARSVARRVIADGNLKGIVVIPGHALGARVGAAFSEEFSRLGGTLLDNQIYEASRADFGDLIRHALQVHSIKGEPSTHRKDAAFIFFAGNAAAARLFMPQLKYQYAGDVPVYATSDSFEPNPSANQDLDGLRFADMPWMIANDSITADIRDGVRASWPARTTRRDRLYAFGFDAYRLVPALRSKSISDSNQISGVTGKLRLDDHNRIRRELDWARMRNGVPAGP